MLQKMIYKDLFLYIKTGGASFALLAAKASVSFGGSSLRMAEKQTPEAVCFPDYTFLSSS